jgi:hypothetical protein
MRVLLYFLLLFLVLLYAIARGGSSERAAAVTLTLGSVLTKVLHLTKVDPFGRVEALGVVIDALVLAAFVVLVVRSNRYWPIWIAALQLLATLAHAAKLVDPTMMRTGYAFLLAIWAYPQLALIAIGAWSHNQRTRRTSVS